MKANKARKVLPLWALIGLGLIGAGWAADATNAPAVTTDASPAASANPPPPAAAVADALAAQAAPTNLAPPAQTNDAGSPARAKMYEAMLNVQDKQYDAAIPKLEAVIAEDPTLLEAWSTLGWAYWSLGRHKDAAELWQRLLNIAPNEPMGYNLMAQVAVHDGNLARADQLIGHHGHLGHAEQKIEIGLFAVAAGDIEIVHIQPDAREQVLH